LNIAVNVMNQQVEPENTMTLFIFFTKMNIWSARFVSPVEINGGFARIVAWGFTQSRLRLKGDTMKAAVGVVVYVPNG